MPTIRILTEAQLRDAVPLDLAAIDCVDKAFATLAGGGVVMPPVLSLPIAEVNGDVCVKTAYIPGVDTFAIKISPGFFDNYKLGLPSTTGLMVVHSAITGIVQAVLLDNGYLTDVRTAAAGAVSARHLAREDAASVTVIGTGVQSRLQLEAICQVRPIRSATICGREQHKADALARDLANRLGITIEATTDIAAAVPVSDIVVTTTPAKSPLVEAAWLRPGQHVVAMGSDQADKVELAAECVTRADLFVVDRRAQSAERGELRYAIERGVVDSAVPYPELGEVIAGQAAGRSSADAITICDLTGTGVQDTAIANHALMRAGDAGTAIES